MKHSFYIVFIFFFIIGCTKTPPRRPINPKPSATIFKANIEASKKIIQEENKKIVDYFAQDSTKTYINSNNGFWYTYVDKVMDSKEEVSVTRIPKTPLMSNFADMIKRNTLGFCFIYHSCRGIICDYCSRIGIYTAIFDIAKYCINITAGA